MSEPGVPVFDVLLLLGRPAAGKSAVAAFLAGCPAEERRQRFGLGEPELLGEGPWLQEAREADEILAGRGRPRLYTDAHRFFLDDFLWDFFVEKRNRAYRRLLAACPGFFATGSLLVELCRGGRDAYRRAFAALDPTLLLRAAILYVDVSYEESAARNRRRRGDGLPELLLAACFRTDDWPALAPDGAAAGSVTVAGGLRLPYSVLRNEPDRTADPAALGACLEEACQRLAAARRTLDAEERAAAEEG